MSILFFDTETTGLVNRKADAWHSSQPKTVQLAAALYTNDGKQLATLSTIIKPDGWVVPPPLVPAGMDVEAWKALSKANKPNACDIHGITQEIAEAEGIPAEIVFPIFNSLASEADMIVAHNADFDVLAVEAHCYAIGIEPVFPDRKLCTMKSTTDWCNIPGQWGKPKWPKLTELYQILFGETFDGAHDALVDVTACARSYFELSINRKFTEWQYV